jgi:DNA polymerase-3 subunit gamma/tau
MYKSLATKYRPKDFSEVVEQTVTIRILQQALLKGKPKNAYLFAGSSGDGKTTLARIFANKINDGLGTPIEIDGATYRGIEEVRAIQAEAIQRDLVAPYKVFIIDEAHEITKWGWDAFLKTLEEPPAHTIFMFCTTEPAKLPATILNRLQRFNITKISNEGIRGRLEFICQQEGFVNYTDTCDMISKICQGCMRDAITLLEQCADFSTDLSIENTKQVLGSVTMEVMMKLTNFLVDGDESKVFAVIETLYNEGVDLKQFISNYLDFVLDLCKYILFRSIDVTNIPKYMETTEDSSINIQYTTGIDNNLAWFNKLSDRILEIKNNIKYDSSYKSTIEAYLLKTCRGM